MVKLIKDEHKTKKPFIKKRKQNIKLKYDLELLLFLLSLF